MDLSRVAYVIGQENIAKLQAAHVAVVGLGGVGSYIAEALARSGVGQLDLVDDDTVSLTNLNRQMTDEQLDAAGVGADLIRLSCGLEDARDLIADIQQAIEQV